jgi:hypothetical protein
MAWLSDEAYELQQDTKDKKITARSARHTRSHCGKGGQVRFPSDSLSKKEREAMNGECKSYRMNDPLSWSEFKSMPADLQAMYIKAVRDKYKVPNNVLAEHMGVHPTTLSHYLKCIGVNAGRESCADSRKWDGMAEFEAWWHGVPVEERTDDHVEEAPVIETMSMPDYPISWKEFTKLPEQIRIDYVNYIREKFNAPDKEIAKYVFKCNRQHLGRWIRSAGLGLGKASGGQHRVWDEKGFLAWCGVETETGVESVDISHDELIAVNEEPEIEVTEEVVPEVYEQKLDSFEDAVCEHFIDECFPMIVEPKSSKMKFEGSAEEILYTLSRLMGDNMVRVKIKWEVL